MKVEKINFFDTPSGKFANYSSENHCEIVRLIEGGGIVGLCVRSENNWVFDGLDFLADCSNLMHLIIYATGKLVVDPIYELKNLKSLVFNNVKCSLDFSRLEKLSVFSTHDGLVSCENIKHHQLEELIIWGYRGRSNDLSDLPQFSNIKKLTIIRSNVFNLNGLSSFEWLISIELHFMKNLESISHLNLPFLQYLTLENCKKIADYSPLSNNKALLDLKIHESAAMANLEFVRDLPKLRSFRFINTNVINGDLSPLIGLEDVCFTQKKHFSYKLSDFS
ncbi:hypothetical protein [Deefgea piscis]|uniref:hypothetical protein n=1 Tax=Deefgea piscis TaxID=2739061 RepID=UPI001C8202AF|nr:hypothetical protein [Deefgea piscis]QZA80071.1 hypothetical protein K4H25_11020 [Deefgea piscis]